MNGALVTFTIYLVALLIIGWIAYRSTKSYDDYILGGRGLNPWVTSLSAQASDMSSFLLMGLPGAAYMTGMSSIWTAIGLTTGTLFNWRFIAKPLRRFTELTDSMTIASFFENRFEDKTRILRIVSSIIVVVFFIVNISAELVGSGKLLSATFGYDYNLSLIIGLGIVVIFTVIGGFFAVAWTDFFQGILIFLGVILIPLILLPGVGGFNNIINEMGTFDADLLHVMNNQSGWLPFSAIVIGALALSLGYPGQPHILVRFMAIKKPSDMRKGMLIAMVWVIASLYGAILIGFIGHGADIAVDDSENVIVYLAQAFLSPWMVGVVVAIVMSAIMSSVSSYLLVAATAVAEDFIAQVFKKELNERSLKLIGQISIIIVSIIAFLLARPGGLVFVLALFAWAGLGSSIGTVIILSLYWKRITKWGAVTGMIVGMLTTILWYSLGFSAYIHEIFPGVIFSIVSIIIVSLLTEPPSDDMRRAVDKAKKPLQSEYEALKEYINE